MAERRTCTRCGRPWFPWAGSKLQTHARCHFSPEEQDSILTRYEADPRLTELKLAAELDVSASVVRATIRVARERRGTSGAPSASQHADEIRRTGAK